MYAIIRVLRDNSIYSLNIGIYAYSVEYNRQYVYIAPLDLQNSRIVRKMEPSFRKGCGTKVI